MRKPPPSAVTKWLPLLLLSHLSHGKLIQWTINEEMEPGTKIIIDLPQELGLDRRPEGYTFKVFFSGIFADPCTYVKYHISTDILHYMYPAPQKLNLIARTRF